MMRLTLSPSRGLPGAPETALSVDGDVLTVDGAEYDLQAVPEGGEATPSGDHPFIGTITRQSGVIEATVLVSLGDTAQRDQPGSPWVVEVSSGPVTIPALRLQEPEPEESP